ncbi:MAG TPA: DUF11 domain-containing protein, partial [Thermoanaerobaculia bacterium]|nr:DUF11 domain-containing protein [Thermoanaerobaculia bacterium]
MTIEIKPVLKESVVKHVSVIALLILAWSSPSMAVIIYDNIPAPLPPNVVSEAFQADHTSEFGEFIQFAGTSRKLTTVNVIMSDHAQAQDYTGPNAGNCPASSACTATGWSHPITLNLYNVDNSGPTPAPGTLIATMTQTFAIPWRPNDDLVNCSPGQWFNAANSTCYTGVAFPITFDFTSMNITLPDQIIYGIAFNTETFGNPPLNQSGPYISLNVGVNTSTGPAPLGPPTVGSNAGDPDIAYQNQNSSGFVAVSGWTPYSAASSFEAEDADLAVTKNGPATVVAGTAIAYAVTVTNNGSNDAQSVTLTDNLPAGTTFVSDTQTSGPTFTCTNGAAISCSIDTLPNGASASFTFVFQLSPSAAGTLSNTASVTSATSDSVPGNNSATSTATITSSADVVVAKSGPPTVTAGNNVTYIVTVTNAGPSDAQTVSLSDATPANTTFVSENQTSGPLFACSNPAPGGSGNTVCTIGTLASGASATFTIVDQVSIGTAGGTNIMNTATATSGGPDSNPANNSSSASTSVSGGTLDLAIAKTASPGPYGTGQPITYSIVVNNAGPAPAGGATVTDILPAGTTFVSATPSQGSCSGTSTVTCSLGTIASGGTATVSLVVTLPSTPGSVSNTATVSSSNTDTNPANNSAT